MNMNIEVMIRERLEVEYVVMVGMMEWELTLPWLVSLEATPLL